MGVTAGQRTLLLSNFFFFFFFFFFFGQKGSCAATNSRLLDSKKGNGLPALNEMPVERAPPLSGNSQFARTLPPLNLQKSVYQPHCLLEAPIQPRSHLTT